MQIKDLFKKAVDRPIEGVIKADDTSQLLMEVEEYVITNEIAAKLNELFDAYNNSTNNTGVWISGFFGSGKSHLLKILSLVLANEQVDGQSAGEIFLNKAQEIDNSFLAGEIEQALRYKTKSILFNIDQKADVITKKENDAILAVFVKVFNELRGYYPKQPYIAAFEHDLDKQGLFETFKDSYLEITGKSWEKARKTALLLKSPKFAEVYHKVTGNSTDDGHHILDHYRDTFSMSIEDFAEEVAEYIKTQGDNFRLNFFVDEVGQFIADNSKLMVNLQTIVETLSTKCQGKAWVMVTSQEDLSKIVGEMAKVHNASDFSKIQDRFSTRPKLTSQDVEEVIQKRLLAKSSGVASDTLIDLYEKEKDNFKTLFDFGSGSRRYGTFDNSEAFSLSYPFPRYQYDLFQAAINDLSQHNAFTGKHSSVGERSMLGVFQQVAKEILNKEVGSLATFDLMFEGIRNVVKTEHQNAVISAEKNLGNPLQIRVLKALFLVKYLKEFKATARNVAILVTNSFNVDLAAHLKAVQEALNELENQTYIQRTGENYHFLTNDEKDIENEIKQVDVANSQIIDCASKIIYESILGVKKFEHGDSGNAYTFSRYTDNCLLGREQEVGIHIVTPINEFHADESKILNDSLASQQMFIILPEDKRFYQDLRTLEQTEKYVKQFNSSGATSTRRLLIEGKAAQNRKSRSDLTNRIKEALGKAKIIINGSTIEIRSSDAKTRLYEGFQALVSDVYTNLKMLKIRYTLKSLEQVMLKEGDDLFREDDSSISEPENEILTEIKRRKNEGSSTTVAKLLETFSSRPYGWGDPAILTNIGKISRRGKIELLANATLLEGKAAYANLSNSNKYIETTVQLQRDFDQKKVKALKELHEELFHKRNEAADPKDIAEAFISELKGYVTNLQHCLARKGDFHFVDKLQPAIDSMSPWLEKDYSVFLSDIDQVADDWLDLKEDDVTPITDFIQGQSGELYASIKAFYKDNRENHAAIDELPEFETLEEIVLADAPYRGNKLQGANSALSICKKHLDDTIEKKRTYAISQIESINERFKSLDGFENLPERDKIYIFSLTDNALKTIKESHLLATIDNTLNIALNQGYQKQLNAFNTALDKAKPIIQPKPIGSDTSEGTVSDHVDTPYAAKQILAASIQMVNKQKSIASEDDLDTYLKQLKTAYMEKLNDGFHIQL